MDKTHKKPSQTALLSLFQRKSRLSTSGQKLDKLSRKRSHIKGFHVFCPPTCPIWTKLDKNDDKIAGNPGVSRDCAILSTVVQFCPFVHRLSICPISVQICPICIKFFCPFVQSLSSCTMVYKM